MIGHFSVWRGLLVYAVAALLVAACAKDDIPPVEVEKQAFEDLRTELREVIDDPVRETEALRLVTVLEEDLARLRDSIKQRRQRARELNANYDTTREEFETFMQGVEADVRENRVRVSATHQALLAAVMEEERATVRKTHTRAMNSAIRSIQAI